MAETPQPLAETSEPLRSPSPVLVPADRRSSGDNLHSEPSGPASPSSPIDPGLLSRFEFEAGKGNEGTKVLLVEWDSLTPAAKHSGLEAEVTWDGKGQCVATHDRDNDAGKTRVLFLLPPGSTVPPLITIRREDVTLTSKPLPAIFPPALGGQRADEGSRGVLHTSWARKRLSELELEMTVEMEANGEGVGLEMAVQERQWILEHFGLAPPPTPAGSTLQEHKIPRRAGPISPRDPIGGRLGEKLKGLKLATGTEDLALTSRGPGMTGGHLGTQAHSSSEGASRANIGRPSIVSLSQNTPARNRHEATISLNAVLAQEGDQGQLDDPDQDEDLFVLPMSPRSPEMTKSPFSFR